MIEPTARDIGRPVIYTPQSGPTENGVIVGFNARYVFVRYGSDVGSKATSREHLDWRFDILD